MPKKSGRVPDFPLDVSRLLSSQKVQLMSEAGVGGAYLLLLANAWISPDRGLPNDDAVLANLSGLGKKWEGQNGELIRSCFFEKEGRLYNRVLLEKWDIANAGKGSKVEGGRKGGTKSKRLQSRGSKKIYVQFVGDQEAWFRIWWKEYPRKEDKLDAMSAFASKITSYSLFIETMIALRKQVQVKHLENIKFISYPATWIRRKRWLDQITPGKATSKTVRCDGCYGRYDPELWDKCPYCERLNA